MESKNADFLRESVIERCRRMTPVERLKKFIEHSQRMKRLKAKGDADRKSASVKEPNG